MERIELTKSEIFFGFFKTKNSLIKFDEIKSHLEKGIAQSLDKSERFTGVPLDYNVNLHWLLEYIRDQLKKYTLPDGITLSINSYELLLTKPGELHPTIDDIDPYNLYASPDYTILFGLDSLSYVTLFFDNHRHKNKNWHIPLEKDKFLIFNSSIKYDFSPNESKENRFIIKMKVQKV